MKKLLLLLAILSFGLMASAQKGRVITVTADTLQGNETVNFAIGTFTGTYEVLTIEALCTQLGGTSGGTLTIYGSLDNTNWSFINGVGGEVITASPKASITGADLNQITITDALVASWVIKDLPYKYYRLAGVGTASDTTLVQIKYIYK